MPFIVIRMVRDGATAEQKARTIAGITDVMTRELGKPRESTQVVFEEFEAEDWGSRGISVAQMRAEAKVATAKAPARNAVEKASPIKRGAAKK